VKDRRDGDFIDLRMLKRRSWIVCQFFSFDVFRMKSTIAIIRETTKEAKMTPPTMRAQMFDGPATDSSRTRVGDAAKPEPTRGHVLIRVTHASINFKDVMMRRGDSGYVTEWPVIPGLEVAGVIEQVGEGVDRLRVGTRVAALTNTGGLAEYVSVSATLATHIPDEVGSEVAAVVPGVWATAWLLLHDAARVRAGDTILVHSASGGVGAAIAALANAIADIRLIGVVGSARRLDDAKRAGYALAFVRGENLAEDVLARLGGAKVDVVLDPLGTTWLDSDLSVMAPAGRIVLFGNASGAALAPIPTDTLYTSNAAVGGFSISTLSRIAPQRVRRAMDEVLSLIADGTLTPRPLVSEGLDSAGVLQQQLSDGSAKGKYVVSL
jgi:NADPH2:quinone reductase